MSGTLAFGLDAASLRGGQQRDLGRVAKRHAGSRRRRRRGVVAEHARAQELVDVGGRRAGRIAPGEVDRAQGVRSACTVISLRVNVPVLSDATTVVLPRVSTAGRWRTIACLLAIRCTPIASAIVTTAGRPSGTAATARLMPARAASPNENPRSAAIAASTIAATPIAAVIARPTRSSSRVSGVCSGSACSSSAENHGEHDQAVLELPERERHERRQQ
jgi:hypothetical protein